jgi:hypothetical protein
VLILQRDDAKREYAYGPPQELPDTTVGNIPHAMYDDAMEPGWAVITMKND